VGAKQDPVHVEPNRFNFAGVNQVHQDLLRDWLRAFAFQHLSFLFQRLCNLHVNPLRSEREKDIFFEKELKQKEEAPDKKKTFNKKTFHRTQTWQWSASSSDAFFASQKMFMSQWTESFKKIQYPPEQPKVITISTIKLAFYFGWRRISLVIMTIVNSHTKRKQQCLMFRNRGTNTNSAKKIKQLFLVSIQNLSAQQLKPATPGLARARTPLACRPNC
jgi:hypothetical protein